MLAAAAAAGVVSLWPAGPAAARLTASAGAASHRSDTRAADVTPAPQPVAITTTADVQRYAVLRAIEASLLSRHEAVTLTLTAPKPVVVQAPAPQPKPAATTPAPVQQAAPVAAAPAPAGSPQQIAMAMLASYGWSSSQFSCLDSLWQHESGWNVYASNPGSGAYGIPQALPGSKMASAGPNWQTDAATQIRWGLSYIQATYGSPCGAWGHEQSTGWY